MKEIYTPFGFWSMSLFREKRAVYEVAGSHGGSAEQLREGEVTPTLEGTTQPRDVNTFARENTQKAQQVLDQVGSRIPPWQNISEPTRAELTGCFYPGRLHGEEKGKNNGILESLKDNKFITQKQGTVPRKQEISRGSVYEEDIPADWSVTLDLQQLSPFDQTAATVVKYAEDALLDKLGTLAAKLREEEGATAYNELTPNTDKLLKDLHRSILSLLQQAKVDSKVVTKALKQLTNPAQTLAWVNRVFDFASRAHVTPDIQMGIADHLRREPRNVEYFRRLTMKGVPQEIQLLIADGVTNASPEISARIEQAYASGRVSKQIVEEALEKLRRDLFGFDNLMPAQQRALRILAEYVRPVIGSERFAPRELHADVQTWPIETARDGKSGGERKAESPGEKNIEHPEGRLLTRDEILKDTRMFLGMKDTEYSIDYRYTVALFGPEAQFRRREETSETGQRQTVTTAEPVTGVINDFAEVMRDAIQQNGGKIYLTDGVKNMLRKMVEQVALPRLTSQQKQKWIQDNISDDQRNNLTNEQLRVATQEIFNGSVFHRRLDGSLIEERPTEMRAVRPGDIAKEFKKAAKDTEKSI